ncbi:hypothetical protein ACFQZO_10915 [Bradyrhizobium sp. GCM10027634]|uniref:carboxylate--amine ligase n=1 Tax=unclassified Bradyrhizobium TaxID=2631580 RepID=UPI00263BC9EB|nr:hypothetical protein [Bradyrhizobium sp. WYCCWR 12677]MDN5001394.1 hypothetical protein [Bradyrhizobium sp. WYCCWR 12677]
MSANNQFSRSSERRVPAVVIGGELNGLGVCRSLAMGGMPIWVVDCKRSKPALWSRYAHQVLTASLHGPALISFLRDLQGRIGEPPFLAITDEQALLTISEHRKDLDKLYRFRLPAHETVLMLHDKAKFHESSRLHGWPVPNGAVVRTVAELPRIAALRPPMILKPADKRHVHAGRAPRLITAVSCAEAMAAAEKLLPQVGEILVQEIIEGPDDNIFFCLFYRGRERETLGMFTGRKLASTPPGTGSTAFCTAAANNELERTTIGILDQLNYSGFGGIEYKRDARSGRFLIVEPTVGRTDWQEEVATLAGVNIPLIAYRHELDLRSFPNRPIDRRMVWQSSWIERVIRRRSIPPRSIVVDGYWRRDDPLPACVHYPHDAAHNMTLHLRPWVRALHQKLESAVTRRRSAGRE